MVFKGADASGFEEDARVTAIWLWTLFAGQSDNGDSGLEEAPGEENQNQPRIFRTATSSNMTRLERSLRVWAQILSH